jgi:hypothetical protein
VFSLRDMQLFERDEKNFKERNGREMYLRSTHTNSLAPLARKALLLLAALVFALQTMGAMSKVASAAPNEQLPNTKQTSPAGPPTDSEAPAGMGNPANNGIPGEQTTIEENKDPVLKQSPVDGDGETPKQLDQTPEKKKADEDTDAPEQQSKETDKANATEQEVQKTNQNKDTDSSKQKQDSDKSSDKGTASSEKGQSSDDEWSHKSNKDDSYPDYCKYPSFRYDPSCDYKNNKYDDEDYDPYWDYDHSWYEPSYWWHSTWDYCSCGSWFYWDYWTPYYWDYCYDCSGWWDYSYYTVYYPAYYVYDYCYYYCYYYPVYYVYDYCYYYYDYCYYFYGHDYDHDKKKDHDKEKDHEEQDKEAVASSKTSKSAV